MLSNKNSFSRRALVSNLGAGIAGATVAAAVPALAEAPQRENTAAPLSIRLRSTSSPLRYNSATWPGLASKMMPPPDHGETSYKGSGRLTGRKALITGGDSGMGRAAAVAYAREGADEGRDHEFCEISGKDAGVKRNSVNGVAPEPIYTPLQISGARR